MRVSGRQISTGVVLIVLLLCAWGADSRNRVWQHGEILSIKEDVFADDSTAYVYCLRSGDVTYRVAFATPLKASIHTTVKFVVDKKSMCVEDVDGKTRSAAIVEHSANPPHH